MPLTHRSSGALQESAIRVEAGVKKQLIGGGLGRDARHHLGDYDAVFWWNRAGCIGARKAVAGDPSLANNGLNRSNRFCEAMPYTWAMILMNHLRQPRMRAHAITCRTTLPVKSLTVMDYCFVLCWQYRRVPRRRARGEGVFFSGYRLSGWI
jgi:hypothetical protein